LCSKLWGSRHLQYCCISEIYRLLNKLHFCVVFRLFYYKNQHCITNLVIKQLWPLCCLFFFDIRILLTPLVSSSFSCTKNSCRPGHLKQPSIIICVLNCIEDWFPRRSPYLNVYLVHLIRWAWWRMDQAGNTNILNSIWSYLAFWRNMFSDEFIAPPSPHFFVCKRQIRNVRW